MTDVGDQMKTWIFYGFILYSIAPGLVLFRVLVLERPPDKDGKTFFDGPLTILHYVFILVMVF